MFLLTCPSCQRDYLVGARSVARLDNVRPGVIALELSCPRGHRVLGGTGNQVADPAPKTSAPKTSAPEASISETSAPEAQPVPICVPC